MYSKIRHWTYEQALHAEHMRRAETESKLVPVRKSPLKDLGLREVSLVLGVIAAVLFLLFLPLLARG